MTLNTVSAMGLLTVGIFGFPFLGAVQDHYKAQTVIERQADLYEQVKTEGTTFQDVTDPNNPKQVPIYESKNFFGWRYDSINTVEFGKMLSTEGQQELEDQVATTSQKSLRVAAVLPAIMAAAFLLIIVYFRLKGGYEPVILNQPIDEPEAATF